MLAWLEELTHPASWRDSEEAVMEFYSALLAGSIPEAPARATATAYRRLGYLLELAALRCEGPNADRLSRAAREVGVRLQAVAQTEPGPAALIGPPRSGSKCGDEVALRWGLTAGLDLDRFSAYRAAHPAENLPSGVVPRRDESR